MIEQDELVVSGPIIEARGTEELVGDLIFRSLKKQPKDKLFQILIDPCEKVTFGEFFKLCVQIADGLIKQGLKEGDVVTLVGDNSTQLHAFFVGAIWAGGIPNPVSGSSTVHELSALLVKYKPKWIIAEPSSVNSSVKCKEILKLNARIVVLNSSSTSHPDVTRIEDIISNDVNVDRFVPRSVGTPEDTILILSSSGTTGIPKGVALSHYYVTNQYYKWQFIPRLDFMSSQVVTSFFSWVTGVVLFILACCHGCFRVVTTTSDADKILQTVEKYKAYGILLPPTHIKYVLDCPNFDKYDTSSLKEIYCGGSILGQETEIKFKEKWKTAKLFVLYGMTETGFLTLPSPNQPIGSCGFPFFNTKIKIVDLETGKSLRTNERGEILVNIDTIFTEYVGDEEATRETFTDGWFRTGDLGYYDEDGNIYIYSRIKEMMKFENIQIAPSEIEVFVLTLPGVSDCGVTGIPVGEDSYALLALVVKSPGATISAKDIQDSVAQNFSKAKHLKEVYFVDECPRTVSRKIKRIALREIGLKLYEKSKGATA